jgi:hypothetical protein
MSCKPHERLGQELLAIKRGNGLPEDAIRRRVQGLVASFVSKKCHKSASRMPCPRFMARSASRKLARQFACIANECHYRERPSLNACHARIRAGTYVVRVGCLLVFRPPGASRGP